MAIELMSADDTSSKTYNIEEDFITEVRKSFQKIIDLGRGKCCVCHHDLDYHIDEGNYWRCHALGADAYQCECILDKRKAKNDINFYDLALRAKEQIDEFDQPKL